MNYTNIQCESNFKPSLQFRSGVSLHSHTLHSRERLDFIYRLAKSVQPIRFALERGEARYRRFYGTSLDLSRAWWTPPVGPQAAWNLEAGNIENRFALSALVSLTDHDEIQAPAALQVLNKSLQIPISVEWTVPFRYSFFHLGVHNLAAEHARSIMAALAAFTAAPVEDSLNELLGSLAANRGTLIVFNHPYWDEKGIGEANHRALARHFASSYKSYIHAFELNGLRPWRENRTVFELARLFDKPLISGGDRHAMEPNTILNVTNAASFSEFVEEIREGFSDVLVTRQYLEPLRMRMLQNLQDILGDQEDHPLGWRRWSDRAFYLGEDGLIRSFTEAWDSGEPWAVRTFTRGLQMLQQRHMKQAFRVTFARREEVVP